MTRENELLQEIIEEIEDGFIETDFKGITTRFNAAFCKIIGHPSANVKGLSYKAYMDEQTAASVYQTFNKVYRTAKLLITRSFKKRGPG